ncbi:MAG: hypothetical protein K5765_07745 [Clostridia bacterium]|nr:hypothetical protein [Clostridia bacterium]
MEEKFKKFLEEEFKKISPTKAAMEYRKRIYKDMLNRVQELKIKGMTDEELIIDTVLDDYVDIEKDLIKFEETEIKTDKKKRFTLFAVLVSLFVVLAVTITYLLVGFLAHIWHPTWLIIVGGIFINISVFIMYKGVSLAIKKKYVVFRILLVIFEILVSVFTFLILQLVIKLNGSWMTFLAMVFLILCVDTIISFFTGSKIKWIELPIMIEITFVIVYVMLGLLLNSFWHIGWLLCLVGVVFALAEIISFVVINNKKKNKEEDKKIKDKYVKTDPAYWTNWDD